MEEQAVNTEATESVEDNTEETVPVNALDLEPEQQLALVQALLFAHGDPLSADRLGEVTGLPEDRVKECLNSIKAQLLDQNSGVELVCVAEKYQLRTRAVFAPFIRELKSGRPRRLSNPALETLAIVAYRQPIVKSDIERIRGVDVTPTLKTLLERRLIRIIGHQASVGQPALYGTTEDFLKLFGLGSLSELPTLRDLKEITQDPGEVEEFEDAAEVNAASAEGEGPTQAAPVSE